ncbi:rolling circle replication-associated protein [Megasphaera massiliensis]|uniref:rolling circle replication-associated protein n=1 Tax=Megasphaera massiliensis TaxID=1232428 RepID=UPI000411CF6B|nr:hypothetical protein [Megasphaera massiliensis]DAF84479.1 MAG TPA: Replication associated protein [Caudoviricetes sp.]
MKSFVREKKIFCGKEYFELDLFEMADMRERGRKEKGKKSSLKQIKQNEKNARRYFTQLVNTNFGKNDYCIHATYNRAHMPETVEEAEANVKKYIRRIKNRRNRLGIEAPLKYIIVTEYRTKEDGSPTRIHHHIIMDGAMDRDEISELWRDRRKKGEKQGATIGVVNVDRLQPDEYGLEALARYLTKGLTGKKRWHPSKNLEKPIVKKNDYKFSRRKLVELSGMTDCPDIWEKLYPGYTLTEAKSAYSDEAGWHITVKMRREGKYGTFYNLLDASKSKRVRKGLPGEFSRRQ